MTKVEDKYSQLNAVQQLKLGDTRRRIVSKSELGVGDMVIIGKDTVLDITDIPCMVTEEELVRNGVGEDTANWRQQGLKLPSDEEIEEFLLDRWPRFFRRWRYKRKLQKAMP